MAKKAPQRTFNDVLSTLGTQRFDVAPAHEGAKRTPNAFKVSKYGAPPRSPPRPMGRSRSSPAPAGSSTARSPASSTAATRSSSKPARLEIPATADHLRAIHEFSEELKEAVGSASLYNESLGTTSDVYVYDRVKGRPTD